MSEFNKYSTDGGATFIDVEDSNAVHWSQAEGYVGKNRNSMPYYASSGTTHGITKVINADGTININNTTTGTDFVEFHQRTLHNNDTDLYLPIGDYYVTIEADKSIDVSKTHFTVNRTVNGSDVGFNTSKNIGSTYHFSITADTTCDYKKSDGSCLVGFYVYFDSGLAFDNVTIKPMIRDSSIPDSTYEPWYMTNRELTEEITRIPLILTPSTDITIDNVSRVYYSEKGKIYLHLRFSSTENKNAFDSLAIINNIPQNAHTKTTLSFNLYGVDLTDGSTKIFQVYYNGAGAIAISSRNAITLDHNIVCDGIVDLYQ